MLGGAKTVADLVSGKELVDVEAENSVEAVLELLKEHDILAVPIYGAAPILRRHAARRGAGAAHLFEGGRQYCGIVSVLDLVAFVVNRERGAGSKADAKLSGGESAAGAASAADASKAESACADAGGAAGADAADADAASLRSALESPVHLALGATSESTSLWIEPATLSVWSAVEKLAKGAHRLLVPLPGGSVRLVTQSDALRFLAQCHRGPHCQPELRGLLDSRLYDLNLGPGQDVPLLRVDASAPLLETLSAMATQQVRAVPVLQQRRLVSTLSVSDLRGMAASSLRSFDRVTVSGFLKGLHPELAYVAHPQLVGTDTLPAPLTCRSDDRLIDIIDSLLGCNVHRSWVVNNQLHPLHAVSATDVLLAVLNARPLLEGTHFQHAHLPVQDDQDT
ncbi:hypothetical protein M885DRAFT_620161 [Pelagophyceae sp. CCMP2097]|nr:hypothetical protein M885DRAFT_620161 [Pelagophyceae sp. CCMP2097]